MKQYCVLIVLVVQALCASRPANAQGTVLPWGQHSDMVAWEEFAQITAPAGNPSLSKVEFETWPSDDDIYVKSPAQWPLASAPKLLQPSALARTHASRINPFVFQPGQCLPPQGLPAPNGNGAATGLGFPQDGCIGEEVRRNWASFQYIVSNGLDSRAGLAKAFAAGFKVDLPADATEFKGDWAKVSDVAKLLSVDVSAVRKNYYTSYSTNDGVNTEIALLSFHISSKQIKNWVWADFEGAMNPGRCDVIGCRDSFGAAVPVVAPNARPYQSYGACEKSASLRAMLENAGTDAIWNNYCLKGSQVSFIGEDGKDTLLGNSVIEPLNAGVPIAKSSCITCHGYASFNKDGRINGFAVKEPLNSPTGKIDKTKMNGYLSNDFIWGISLKDMK
jgi:hypothetical protein